MAYGTRFETALAYAARLHRDQERKSTGVPYVTHLLAVAAIVGEDGGSEDEVIAALLHDAVEDQGGHERLEEIRSRFGDTVAAIVLDCSDATTIPKPPWEERKRGYIARVPHKPAGAIRVAAADKLHNGRATVSDLRERGDEVWRRFRGGRDGTLWYFAALTSAYEQTGHAPRIVAELRRTVEEMYRVSAEPLPAVLLPDATGGAAGAVPVG